MSQERPSDDVARVVAYVEWVDSGIASTSWDQREDVLKTAHEITATPMRSAGLLLDDGDVIVLAGGLNPNNDDVLLVHAIPKHNIVRMDVWSPRSQESQRPPETGQRVCVLEIGHEGLHRGKDGSEWSWFETTGHHSPALAASESPETERVAEVFGRPDLADRQAWLTASEPPETENR